MQNLRNLFILSLLIGLTSCNTEDEAYALWDLNDDGISREEFYERWYSAGYWNLWDRNNDGVIDEEEWNSGLDSYYDKFDRDQIGYNDFDLDNDGFLDSEEMTEGEFVLWDTDNDGSIDKVEFNEKSYPVPPVEDGG